MKVGVLCIKKEGVHFDTPPSLTTFYFKYYFENISSKHCSNSSPYKLTATITPSNATNKNITWKSSDKSIAEISITGELTAKKHGTVDITATSSNGKTSTIKINIKESQKVEDKTIIETSTTNKNNDNTTANKKEESNALDGILVLGLLGGGGYWGYKKYKKQKHNNQCTKK